MVLNGKTLHEVLSDRFQVRRVPQVKRCPIDTEVPPDLLVDGKIHDDHAVFRRIVIEHPGNPEFPQAPRGLHQQVLALPEPELHGEGLGDDYLPAPGYPLYDFGLISAKETEPVLME